MLDYMDPNFDIKGIASFNNIDGLKGIASYLDFAIETTIRRQVPNVDTETEKRYAEELLTKCLNGDKVTFTRTNNIRSNMNHVSMVQLKGLIMKNLIEKEAFNQRIRHLLSPTEYMDQCTQYVTSMAYNGKIAEMDEWFTNNLPLFIHEYINTNYKRTEQQRQQYEDIAYSIPETSKALEQLNLEMHLQQIKTK